MSDSDPYSRHYWRLVDDPKFADIYGDDHHFALWSRLLMIADQAWPATAHLPLGARRASVAKLQEVKLIHVLPGGRFRMNGTDNERAKRSHQASNAAALRWQYARTADAMPSKAKQSKEEKSIFERMLDRREKDYQETGVWFKEWGPTPDSPEYVR